MYYPWTWWWVTWIIPMAFVAWALFSWSGGRYRRYGPYRGYGYGPYLRDEWDDHWTWPRRGPTSKNRNRGPLNYRRSDARIAEDINDRLLLDEEIDPSAMSVQVRDGAVILQGMVETRFEKRLAERIADGVAGVTDVENQLKIGRLDRMSQPQAPSPLSNAAPTEATSH
ncbi:MAG TPA: BON domain-containing protein [Polyangiaceae bacterium]|nr:BON domain-containing protein [Polyangiaceae bacterium]